MFLPRKQLFMIVNMKTDGSKLDIHQFYKGQKATNIMFELIILVKTSITSDKLGTAEFVETIASLGDLSKQIEIAIEQSIQQYVADEYYSPIYEFEENDVDLVGELLTWNEYNQGEYEKQKVEIILDPNEQVEEIKIPEIIEYIEDCTSCSILPVVELPVKEDGSIEPPPAGEPMVNSLTGDGIAVDLCAATSNQLIFTVNTAGTPPFQENVQP